MVAASVADPALPPRRAARPWEVLDRQVVLARPPFGTVLEETYRLPDGRVIEGFMRFELRSFVCVFAVIETDAGPVVPMVEQYRVGPRGLSLELPAGFIEDGEEPAATARRELREEAGCEASVCVPLGRYVMNGNRECGYAHIFLATGARSVEQDPHHGDLGELILHFKPLAEVRQLWADGASMTEAVAVMAVALALRAYDARTASAQGQPQQVAAAYSQGKGDE
jgi:ADP-ribose pyrophosphatase